jgi:DNA mismatch repair ATPase MutS
LNLDQIIDPILSAKKEFELEPFFYAPLQDAEIVAYRQDVMRELTNSGLRTLLTDFSMTVYDIGKYMNTIRSALASGDRWHNNYLTRGHMLDYADKYCRAVFALTDALSGLTLHSGGLRGFAEYIASYHRSDSFTGLSGRVKQLRDSFSTVHYCMLIKNGVIRVRKYEGQADHSAQILEKFEKFRQGDVKDYRHKLFDDSHAAHVEAAVLDMVAGLYKDIFADLNDFCSKYFRFEDETLLRFSREIQFYISWLEYIAPLRGAGLPFCYPALCGGAEHLYAVDCFDLALAQVEQGNTVVNDFTLDAPERIIVVTGPNQGGKTTFARAFGQIHYLASLGLCVPGREAAVLLFDNILTHFGREEDLSTLNGKLQDDLVRLRALLDRATNKSVVIINEIFASTTLSDALLLGGYMMDAFAALGAPVMAVTFLDELASHGPETVSMMSTVSEDDPVKRTFKIIRKPPDGLAYAIHIAGKHGLTYRQLCGRLGK